MKTIFLFFFGFCACSVVVAQNAPTSRDLTVALDGSGDYKSIQEAINAIRDLGPRQVTIHIRKGIYHEKVVIPSWKTRISLVGENADSTVIINDDYSGKPVPCGKDAYGRTKFSTYTSYTVLIQGNECSLSNLTIENSAGRVGQAVALHVEGDRCTVVNCRLLGNQDTLYAATATSREYYKDCYIEGTTDFIFGEATAVFEHCTIKSLMNSYITAAATTQRQPYGFVFFDCRLIADSGVTKVFLGRPWRPFAKTVYIDTYMGSQILPEGWNPWVGDTMFMNKDRSAFYAEYRSSGPGANVKSRVPWSKQLTKAEASNYTVANILGGRDGWDPETALSRAPTYSREVARTVMSLWADSLRTGDRWAYDQGVILKGIEGVWLQIGDDRYSRYIRECMDHFVEPDGTIRTYHADDLTVDNILCGRMLLLLYRKTGEPRYRQAAQSLREQLRRQTRTADGGFGHKKTYLNQMWLDGLYMAEPFYVAYARVFHDDTAFNDIASV